MDDLFSIAGKNIFIVGASSGIGYHSAKLFAKRGANLILGARRKSLLDKLADELKQTGVQIETYLIDVTQPDTLDSALAKIKHPIDVLLNTSGISTRKSILDDTADDWDRLMNVNLKGAWMLNQAVIRHMITTKTKGKLINISSIYGSVTNADHILYATSKAGIEHLTRSLALASATYGININAIAPNYIETDINRDYLRKVIGDYVIKRTPLARLGRLEDLDGVLILLASNASDYITGTTIQVDGGCAVHQF